MKKALLDALKRHPVFTARDIASISGKSREYAYLAAYRMARAGEIRKIEKGKYTAQGDPFSVASAICWPSYISSWAALHYYGLTEQLPFTLHVITTRKRKRKSVSFGNAKIEFITCRRGAFGGFGKTRYGGSEIFIAEKEKAIIDALAFGKMSVGEAAEIIVRNKRKLSMRRLFFHARNFRGIAKKIRGALRRVN